MGHVLTDPLVSPALLRRTISAVIMIPAAVAALYLGGWVFAAVVVVFAALMLFEWVSITEGKPDIILVAGVFPAIAISAAAIVLGRIDAAIMAAITAFVIAGIISAVRHRSVGWALLGVIYVCAPVLAILWLREIAAFGYQTTLLLFLMVWATDIGAYFAGTRIGGPKLAPAISPKKTWSGLIGGMAAAALAAVATGWWFDLGIVPWLAVLGAATAIIGQVGDLAESALKRHFGVKDSGSIIPGHGGILDRLDGLVLAAPALAIFLAVG